MTGLIVPGDGRQSVSFGGTKKKIPIDQRETVLRDGALYELRITGEAEVTRGPLGRFLDLASQIESEGLKVPSEIRDVLDRLAVIKE